MNALETNDVTKRYGGRPVVDAVDLTVERGEVFGLVGPTGAGKSTLLGLLVGAVHPTEGSATVLGLDPWHDGRRLHERVGYLRETVDLDGTRSGWEHLRTATDRPIDDATAAAILERVGIAPDVAARPTRTYSAGIARRLSLAMAFAGDPDLVLLDAPTAGLDRSGRLHLEARVEDAADEGSTVVVASRCPALVERIADRVGVLEAGELTDVQRVDGRAVDDEAIVRLRVDRVPSIDLEAIPGVESVIERSGELIARVSDADAKATIVLEVAHAGAAIHDLAVATLDEPYRQRTTDSER